MLIEAGYIPILDRLWYIYAPRAVRAERLRASRGYSDEKIRQIMRRQLSDRAFRAHADAVIDNGGEGAATERQIDRLLIRVIDGRDRRSGSPDRRRQSRQNQERR